MSKTIEAARTELDRLFDDMLRVLAACGGNTNALESQIRLEKMNAGVSLSPLMCRHYTSGGVGYADFVRELSVQGIDRAVIECGRELGELLDGARGNFTAKVLAGYKDVIARAGDLALNVPRETIQYDRCYCGKTMQRVDLTYLVCECGFTKTPLDTTAREDVSVRDEVVRTTANYTYGRHYEYWSSRIQGIESNDIPIEWLRKIRDVLVRDKYTPEELNCKIIRAVLKDPAVQLTTELNEHASFLVKKFGGRPPYILSADESHRAKEMFLKIMYYYEKQHPEAGNKPYYPYFIYKIYEFMFAHIPDKMRILNYIHLQSPETVRKHDIDLRDICDEAKTSLELKYKPTTRR